MRSWIHVNADALRHNYRTLKALAPKADFVPVIKANAYGHGLKEVYSVLSGENPKWIGVNYLFEAQRLREWGFKGRILVVGPPRPDELGKACELGLDVFIGDQLLKKAWLNLPKRPAAHIKFDTGMSRQGFVPDEADAIAREFLPFRDDVKGVCSHFANVEDVLEHEYANLQLTRFESAYKAFQKHGFTVQRHIASSASTFLLEQSQFDLVRVGISLYGVWPSQKTRLSYMQKHPKLAELKPVLNWRTEIAAIKPVASGDFIGYGCTYKAVHNMSVAVLPVGYYEGYPRIAANNFSYVLIKGQRCPIVGRICMNMMMVDVSHVSAKPGDPVTLIGKDGAEHLEAATVAEWAHTIHYELFTHLCPEIPRMVE